MSFNYSLTSKERFNQLHPDLQLILRKLLKNFDNSIWTGHRGKTEQERMVAEGKSKVHYPNSKHNTTPSLAVDVAPYPRGKTNKSDLRLFVMQAGMIYQIHYDLKQSGLITQELRWGGDWDRDLDFSDQSFDDLAHFELI